MRRWHKKNELFQIAKKTVKCQEASDKCFDISVLFTVFSLPGLAKGVLRGAGSGGGKGLIWLDGQRVQSRCGAATHLFLLSPTSGALRENLDLR